MPGYLPPAPIPPPPRKRSTTLIVGLTAAAVTAALGVGILIGSSGDESPAKSSKASTTAVSKADDSEDEDIWEDPKPTYDEVDVNSFEIELRTKSRKCFGSAGCNVEVEPDLTYLGDTDSLDPDATYEVTYEITGDEDGPILETLDITDRDDLLVSTTLVSTSSSYTEISVEITDVLTR